MNMKNVWTHTAAPVVAALAVAAVAVATSPITWGATLMAQTRLERAVIAAGGGRSAGSATVLECTIGQSAAERSASASTVGLFGFWSAAPKPASVRTLAVSGAAVAVSVAPNPLAHRGAITVTMSGAGHLEVAMYDAAGRRAAMLHAGTMPPGTHVIPLDGDGLAVGHYHVVVSASGTLTRLPLVIVR